MTFKENNALHVYAQYMPHHESFIVGNEKALLELRKMIDEALKKGQSKGDFTTSDGECYQAFVIKLANHEQILFESVELP